MSRLARYRNQASARLRKLAAGEINTATIATITP